MTRETLEKPRAERQILADISGQSGIEVMAWRKKRGISRETFSKLANCSVRKLATYEKLDQLPRLVQRETNAVIRLLGALEEIISDTRLTEWLNTPNPGFENATPLDIIEDGKTDLIWEMIYQTREGAFG